MVPLVDSSYEKVRAKSTKSQSDKIQIWPSGIWILARIPKNGHGRQSCGVMR